MGGISGAEEILWGSMERSKPVAGLDMRRRWGRGGGEDTERLEGGAIATLGCAVGMDRGVTTDGFGGGLRLGRLEATHWGQCRWVGCGCKRALVRFCCSLNHFSISFSRKSGGAMIAWEVEVPGGGEDLASLLHLRTILSLR